jgi:hypothetical protein
MEATTMDATGATGEPKTETVTPETAGAKAPVVEALKEVGCFGLGLAALAVEGTGWLLKSATRKGKEVAPSVAKPFKSAGAKMEDAMGGVGAGLKDVGRAVGRRAEAVEHAMDERISAAVERAGAPVLAEVTELKARIAELTNKLDSLQTRREKQEKPPQS